MEQSASQPPPASADRPAMLAPRRASDARCAPPRDAPRVKIDAPRVDGSISLIGARLDDMELKDYHETVQKSSPLVRIAGPGGRCAAELRSSSAGAAGDGVKVPDDSTLWTSSGGDLTARPSGDADLGQWPGPGLPHRFLHRRELHVHRAPERAQHRRQAGRSLAVAARAARLRAARRQLQRAVRRPARRGRRPHPRVGLSQGRERRRKRTTAPPTRTKAPAAGPASPTNTG